MLIELILILAAIELVANLLDPRERRLRALLREVGREDSEY